MFARLYQNSVIQKPKTILTFLIFCLIFFGYYTKDFKLDASSDTLLIENDPDLKYLREVTDRYGAKDFLVLTFTPKESIISDNSINNLLNLKKGIQDLDWVHSVITILDIPLLENSNKPLSERLENFVTLKNENVDALKKGLVNLQRHIENVKKFGLPVTVAVNHFVDDTDNEVKELINACEKMKVEAKLCMHWANGGEGTKDLAEHVVELIDKNEANFKFLYEDSAPLFKKIETIAKEIYRTSEVIADTKVRKQLKNFEDQGYGSLPICVAKTQYSFSTDPSLKGAPTGHVLPIREIRLSSGAEFIVVVCGAIMTMPGLPREPAANSIKLNDEGEIEGLF